MENKITKKITLNNFNILIILFILLVILIYLIYKISLLLIIINNLNLEFSEIKKTIDVLINLQNNNINTIRDLYGFL